MNVKNIKRWSKYTERSEGYKDLKYVIEYLLERELSEEEKRKVNWLADSSWETVGNFLDMFHEVAGKKGGR